MKEKETVRFVSLGRHCDVVNSLRNLHKIEGETCFFDWLRSDFECVLHLLRTNNIRKVLHRKNLRIDLEAWQHDGDVQITLHHFEKQGLTLMFHHDFKIETYVNGNNEMKERLMQQFLERYERRFQRLISHIRQSNKQPIIFVYRATGTWNDDFIRQFHDAIMQIHFHARYMLAVIVEDIEDTTCPYIQMSDQCFKINVHAFIDNTVKETWHWTNPHFQWGKMFDLMERLYKS